MTTSTAPVGRLRRGWDYYRRYTKRRTGVHAAATAALTGFGLLAYFEQWFVAVAIVAYLLPPVYLYLTGDDLAARDQPFESAGNSTAQQGPAVDAEINGDTDGIDVDSDADGVDADTDGIDTDTDTDGTDTDTDSDSDG